MAHSIRLLKDLPKPLRDKIEQLPLKPGVYLYKDAKGEIIYVGKAQKLRTRVRSYFRPDAQQSSKTHVLVSRIDDLETIVVSNEVEALLLENNLIKKHRPRYNVRLRDDKNYLYAKITAESFPKVILVRRMRKDGGKYFGPYTSGTAIKHTLRLLEKIFPYRKCDRPFEQAQKIREGASDVLLRRCPDSQIGRCVACDPAVSQADHDRIIGRVKAFLDGRVDDIQSELEEEMQQAAVAMEFEKAARLRDQIQEIEHIRQEQQAVMTDVGDRDVFGLAVLGKKACVQLFKVRRGLLIAREEFTLDSGRDPDGNEVLARALFDYYERATEIPPEILLPQELPDQSLFEDWLKQLRTDLLERPSALSILVPQRGDKKQVIDLAAQNAKQRLDELIGAWMTQEQRRRQALDEIKNALDLTRRPERIECYDISHLGGEGTVASMVVFQNGEPRKADYRKFKLRTVSGGDDYAAMHEVLGRRFRHLDGQTAGLAGYKIRQASAKDMKAVEQVLNENKLSTVDLDPQQTLVMKKGQALIGIGRLRVHERDANSGDTVTQIATLWVDQAYRGSKLGYSLMGELLKRAKDRVVYVVPRAELESYYAGFGFEPTQAPPPLLQKVAQEIHGDKSASFLIYDKGRRSKDDLSFSVVPDLVVLDGGKGQLSSVLEAMKQRGFLAEVEPEERAKKRWAGFAFPIVSLAKEDEEVFPPFSSDPVELDPDSLGSLMLQAARDEAHRFANTYQRKVRTKNMLDHVRDSR